MNLTIDQQAYFNRLQKTHPAEKLAFALLSMTVTLIFPSRLLALSVLILMSTAAVRVAGISGKIYARLLLLPLMFFLLGTTAIMIVIKNEPQDLLLGLSVLEYWVGFTGQSLSQAGTLVIRVLAAVSCLYFLILTTPMVDLLELLRKMRVPVLVTELMSLIYRFIFVLLDEAGKITVSQQARLGYRNLRFSFSSLAQLITCLFMKGFFRTQQMNYALMSRCYHGELKVLELNYRYSVRNIILIVLIELVLIWAGLYLGG